MAELKKIATRDSYGNALKELGALHEDLVVLDADLAGATKTGTFQKAFPDRNLYPFMLDASIPLQEAIKKKPALWTLVFGNEGKGLPKEFAGYGQAVRIESNEKVDSLNLGIAAAIAIYEYKKVQD